MEITLRWTRVRLGGLEHYYSAVDKRGNVWEIEPTISDAWVIRKNDEFIATVEAPDAVSRAKARIELMIRQKRRTKHRS